MYFMAAVDICTKDYLPVWNIVGLIVSIIKIGVPIVLILYGMIDLSKAVIANKEDEVKKATKLLGKRFLYAVGVFASVWLVTLVLGMAADTIGKGNSDYDYDEAAWKRCWALINGENLDNGCYMCTTGQNYRWGDYSGDSSCKKVNKSKSNCKEETKKCFKLTTDIGESYVLLKPSNARDANYEEVDMKYCK